MSKASRAEAASRLGSALRDATIATIETAVPKSALYEAAALADQITQLLSTERLAQNELSPLDDEKAFTFFGIVTGEGSPMSIPAVLKQSADGLTTRVNLGRRFVGPPGHVHGGVSALILDEIFGQTVHNAGIWAMTANLEVNFRRAIPLNSDVIFHARVSHVEGRKVTVVGGAHSATDANVEYAVAEALFIRPSEERHSEYFEPLVDSQGEGVAALLRNREETESDSRRS